MNETDDDPICGEIRGRPSGGRELFEYILGGGPVGIASAEDAVAVVRAGYREPIVDRERAVLSGIAVASCYALARYARPVLDALLASALLDRAGAIDLCRRILRERHPDNGLRPALRLLRGRPGPGDEVFELPEGRYVIARRDLTLCRTRHVQDAFRRHAVAALARRGQDAARLVRDALRAKVSVLHGRGHAMGALDLIAERHADLPAPLVRRALERWRCAGVGQVKLRAYQVGAAILGAAFAEPALRDGDRKVRQWAERAVGKAE